MVDHWERGVKKSKKQKGEKIRLGRACIKFYGVQASIAIYQKRPATIRRIFLREALAKHFVQLKETCQSFKIELKYVDDRELDRITASKHHEGVCVEASPKEIYSAQNLLKIIKGKEKILLPYLEGVDNPHNLGAIIRTCAFFGIEYLLFESTETISLSAALCRIAQGAAESVKVAHVKDRNTLFAALKKDGFNLYSTTPHASESIYDLEWPERVVMLFGSEGEGLSEELLKCGDNRFAIPRVGEMESLNVGAAVTVVLSEYQRSRSSLYTTRAGSTRSAISPNSPGVSPRA